MATSYTTLLGFALPVTGELQGTWGDTVNNSITQLCEDSIAGVATASVLSADWTLTTTGSGAANQSRMAILIPTGSPGVSRNIIAPSKSKTYTVINQSNAAVVIKGSATTGVTIAAGDTVVAAWNGSDFVAVKNAAGVFTTITDSALTSGRVTYAGTGGLLQDSANLTFNGTTLTAAGLAGPFNGTVGATTANTGAFTTLSASSTVTVSGGTANGVAYLNGSKVLTSGSALVFDGTNVGIGASSPSEKLTVNGNIASPADAYLYSYTGSSAGTISSGIRLQGSTSTTTFITASSERMRVTSSGNILIGTTNEDAVSKLQVAGKIGATGFSNANGSYAAFSASILQGYPTFGFTQFLQVEDAVNNTYGMSIATTLSGVHTDKFYISGAGNVGIGTSSPVYELDVIGNISAGDGSNTRGLRLGQIGFQAALLYNGGNGNLEISPRSGYATAFKASEAGSEYMRIDSAGRLLIGTTSDYIDTALTLARGTAATWHVGPSISNGNGALFYVVNNATAGVYLASGAAAWSSNSDERLKTGLKPIEDAVNKISTLRAVTGRYKTDKEEVSRSFLIAQDVQAVLPEAVNVQDDEIGTLGVQYTDTIPLLVAAIKELKAELDQLKSQLGK